MVEKLKKIILKKLTISNIPRFFAKNIYLVLKILDSCNDEYDLRRNINALSDEVLTKIPQEKIMQYINKGYMINHDSPNCLKQFKYVKYAVNQGQADALDYLDIENLSEDEKQQLDDLVYYAIGKGYSINKYTPRILITKDNIEYYFEIFLNKNPSDNNIIDFIYYSDEQTMTIDMFKQLMSRVNSQMKYDYFPEFIKNNYKYKMWYLLGQLKIFDTLDENISKLESILYSDEDIEISKNELCTIILLGILRRTGGWYARDIGACISCNLSDLDKIISINGLTEFGIDKAKQYAGYMGDSDIEKYAIPLEDILKVYFKLDSNESKNNFFRFICRNCFLKEIIDENGLTENGITKMFEMGYIPLAFEIIKKKMYKFDSLKDKLDELIKKAINNGYKIEYDSPLHFKQFKYIKYAIENGQFSLLKNLDIENLSEERKQELDIAIEKAINKGYKIGNNSPSYIKQFKYIRYAIENGQVDALEYLNIENLLEEEKQQLDIAIKNAIKKGYNINHFSPHIVKQFKYIKYAIENGQVYALIFLDEITVKEEEYSELDKLVTDYLKRYRIDEESPQFLKQFKYIKYAIKNGQDNALIFLDKTTVKEEEYSELDKLVTDYLKRYRIDEESPQFLKQFKYIKYAIKNGQGDALEYLNIENLSKEEKRQLDTLVYLAIKNGYKIVKNSPQFLKQYEYIKCAIENGQLDVLLYLNNKDLTDEIIDLAIKKGINMKSLISNCLIKPKLKKYVSAYLGYDIDKISYFEDIINIYKHRSTIEKNELLFYTKKDILEKYGFNIENIIKYILCEDPNFNYLNQVIKKNELEEMLNIYEIIKNKYYKDISNAQKYGLLTLVSRNYCKNKELCNYVSKNNLTNSQLNIFYILFEDNSLENIKIDDLDNFENALKSNLIKSLNETTNLDNLRQEIIKYISNLSTNEFNKIITNHINTRTLDIILEKTHNEELTEKVEEMQILLSLIEDILNIDDINKLKEVINDLFNNTEDIIKIRLLYQNIFEKIREIYELEAQEELIDLRKIKKNGKYIDLENTKYTIYAHAFSGNDISELIYPKMSGGRHTICLSPITELSQITYNGGNITVGYTVIPKGYFIGSSNKNISSNTYIHFNSINISRVRDKYNQMTVRESANLSVGHPETIVWREGLIPTCIIMSGDKPSLSELSAQKKLTDIIKKLLTDETIYLPEEMKNMIQDDDFEIKLVKPKTSILSKKETEDKREQKHSEKIEKLKSIKEHIVSVYGESTVIDESTVKGISRINIGGSHTLLQGTINGEYYILKPALRKGGTLEQPFRSYALQTGYRVQQLVSEIQAQLSIQNPNPNSAVEVRITKANIPDIGNNITCAALKNITETSNYSHRDKSIPFTEREVSQFLRELIVDHLIFNYDTKRENFLYDSYGNVYGIDKEQALKFYYKFINSDETIETRFNIDYNPNNVDLIYPEIFEKGIVEISDQTIEECMAIARAISEMSDEEYLKLFENYINTLKNYNNNQDISEEERERLIQAILARKNNLLNDFTEFINNIKSKKRGTTL